MPAFYTFAAFWKFVKNQYTSIPPTTADLTGKNVLIVGATSGLGLEAARQFASMKPARLLLACRNQRKGEKAVEDIVSTTSCPSITLLPVDQASFSSIRAFAARLEEEKIGHIDICVLSAGVIARNFEKTEDGWEKAIQTNHLGTAYLALLLLPYLHNAPHALGSPTPRLVIVASDTHEWIPSLPLTAQESRSHSQASGTILSTLNNEAYSKGRMIDRYAVTKLLNVFFARALASHLSPASPVTVVSINPGLTHSNLMDPEHGSFIEILALGIFKFLLARSTEEGARTYTHAALSSTSLGSSSSGENSSGNGAPKMNMLGGEEEDFHGAYLDTCRITPPSAYVRSEEGMMVQNMLWDETMDILKAMDGKVHGTITCYLMGINSTVPSRAASPAPPAFASS